MPPEDRSPPRRAIARLKHSDNTFDTFPSLLLEGGWENETKVGIYCGNFDFRWSIFKRISKSILKMIEMDRGSLSLNYWNPSKIYFPKGLWRKFNS